jgi:hypothetical protein
MFKHIFSFGVSAGGDEAQETISSASDIKNILIFKMPPYKFFI